MRLLIICLASLLGCMSALAQKPEKVYSVVKVWHPNEWYVTQAKLWKAEVDKNKTNADAWYNYYRASRMMRLTEPGGSGEDAVRRFKRLQGLVDSMEKAIPHTFEFNYVKWANGDNDLSLFPYLQKAYHLDPTRPEMLTSMATYYHTMGDYSKRDEFLGQLYDTGDPIPGLLNYNYNVLQSVAENGILLTSGDNDTYPAWILQAAQGIRKDVMVLNLSLLLVKDHRDRVFKELGIPELKLDPMTVAGDFEKYQKTIIRHIGSHSKKRPVFMGCTVGEDYSAAVTEKLYLVGLAYRYSDEKIDNIAWLKKNVEQHFAMDYLKTEFRKEPFQQVVDHANGNYLVALLTLHEHYILAGEPSKAAQYKELALKIARNSGMEKEVETHIKEIEAKR